MAVRHESFPDRDEFTLTRGAVQIDVVVREAPGRNNYTVTVRSGDDRWVLSFDEADCIAELETEGSTRSAPHWLENVLRRKLGVEGVQA